jgi:hypothetical protein
MNILELSDISSKVCLVKTPISFEISRALGDLGSNDLEVWNLSLNVVASQIEMAE